MSRSIIPLHREAAMKFSTLASECLRYLVATRGYAPTTQEAYDIAAQQFVTFLQSHGHPDDVRAFTAETVEAFATALGERRAHPNSIRQKLSALRTIARHGMRRLKAAGTRPLLTEDPTARFEWPVRQQSNVEIPTPDELRRFLAVPVSKRQRLVRDLLLDTGLRASELCRATIEDLRETPDGMYLAVTVKGQGARRRQRDVPLSPSVAALIQESRIDRKEPGVAEPLLLRESGERYDKHALHHLVTTIAKRAGVTRFSLSPHKFRHLVNALQKMGGVDPHTRSRSLNHASPATLASYDHLLPGELQDARAAQREALARYVGASSAAPAAPEKIVRLAEALARIPDDRLALVLKMLEGLAEAPAAIHRTPESPAPPPNASAENVNPGAVLRDLSS